MNAAHWHLVLNHFPIIGTLIGIVILIVGILMRRRILKNAALFILIIMAALTPFVMNTGEGAEEMIEHELQTEEYLETHEELAEKAGKMMIVTGVLALISLIVYQFDLKKFFWLEYVTGIAAITTFIFMIRVGNSGGEIRHPEIRTDDKKAEESYINNYYFKHNEEYI